MNPAQPQLLSVKSKLTMCPEEPNADFDLANQPQYSRTQSLQSSAASNDYFSDYASDSVSTKSDDTKASYETPPSRTSTPIIQQPQLNSEMTHPPLPAQLATGNTQDYSRRTLSSYDTMSPPTPGVDDTPYILFAIEQLTRDEEVSGHGRHESLAHNKPSTLKAVPEEMITERAALTPPPQEETRAWTTPPRRPISRRPVPEERLVALHPPEGQRWADLGYLPIPLRRWALGILIFVCLWIIAGILFSNLFASRTHTLYDYDGKASPRYFVFQYLPQLLGMIIILWLFVIQTAMYRALPYLIMSTTHNHDRLLQDFRITPANFVLPDLSWFKNGEPLLGVTFFVFWLMNFTIPLLSCLYQTRWVTDDGPARWRWGPVQGVAWALLALFVLLVLVLIYCSIRFSSAKSGLMWDPTSIADLVALFRRTNVFADFERTEVSRAPGDELPPRFLTLGYWTTTTRPEIFHGIGEENAVIKRLTMDFNKREKLNHSQESSFDMERQRYSYASSFTRDIHSQDVRYRWVPWFLRDGVIVAWTIIAVILMIVFLVVSFVKSPLERGFQPLLPSRTLANGFSSANFLYSFLPSLLGMVLFLVWQPIDTFFRSIQPFANLSTPTGASAERSILASYTSYLPGEVIVQALANRDFKVAYISFIGLMSLTLPVLAGGVFTAQLFRADNEVRMVASMPGYVALCVFATIYALSYLAIWPTRKRYLPHKTDTIADVLSFMYASPLMGEAGLANVRTKADLVGRFVGAPVGLTGDSKRSRAQYAIGIFTGRDAKEHLGVDRLSRPGSGEMLVTTGMTR